jgi:hypothetical protein
VVPGCAANADENSARERTSEQSDFIGEWKFPIAATHGVSEQSGRRVRRELSLKGAGMSSDRSAHPLPHRISCGRSQGILLNVGGGSKGSRNCWIPLLFFGG